MGARVTRRNPESTDNYSCRLPSSAGKRRISAKNTTNGSRPVSHTVYHTGEKGSCAPHQGSLHPRIMPARRKHASCASWMDPRAPKKQTPRSSSRDDACDASPRYWVSKPKAPPTRQQCLLKLAKEDWGPPIMLPIGENTGR